MPKKKFCEKTRRRGGIARRGLRSKHIPDIITLQQAHEWPCCANCDNAEYRFRTIRLHERFMNMHTDDWAYVMYCDVCGYVIGRIMRPNTQHK
jgi:predicted nucleic-acid-binding Zn-ribbon protein